MSGDIKWYRRVIKLQQILVDSLEGPLRDHCREQIATNSAFLRQAIEQRQQLREAVAASAA